MIRRALIIIFFTSLLSACSEDDVVPAISKENLVGTWVYQSRDGGNRDPYAEVRFKADDQWEEYERKETGDTLKIGGGIWSLQDSLLTVTFIGSIRLDREITIKELTSEKLVWERNGVKTELLAK